MERASLYVHFPFCVKKCRYCDFCSSAQPYDVMERYIQCLCKELHYKATRYPGLLIDSLYFGGGTPSVVPPELISYVLETLQNEFRFSDDLEFTSEANPGTLTVEWLNTLKQGGLNRLSIGAQAMQDDLLKMLGRIHSATEIKTAVDMARDGGIANVNLDIMYGLPQQRTENYLDTIEQIIRLSPTHISAYSLILEEKTPLYCAVLHGEETLPDEMTVYQMEKEGNQLLKKNGYYQYEISNYAQYGRQCRHNIGYWQDKPYLGFGVSAHSMLPGSFLTTNSIERYRFSNTEDLDKYCTRIASGDFDSIQTVTAIGRDEARFETMMLGLRMNAGVSNQHFIHTHGLSLIECWGDLLTQLVQQGLAYWNDTEHDKYFTLTERGLDVQNQVALSFMKNVY